MKHKNLYLHFIWNARSKCIWRFYLYVPITIKTTWPKMQENKNYFSSATPVYSFIRIYWSMRWEKNEFEKKRNIFRAKCTIYNQQYDVFDTLLKLLWYIFIIRKFPQRVIFFSFHTTWRHSNKVVQQVVPLIATHIKDKNRLNMRCRKGFKNAM